MIALGGGAVVSATTRWALTRRAFTVLLEVDPAIAWQRASQGGRPLAIDEEAFHALYLARLPVYEEVADAPCPRRRGSRARRCGDRCQDRRPRAARGARARQRRRRDRRRRERGRDPRCRGAARARRSGHRMPRGPTRRAREGDRGAGAALARAADRQGRHDRRPRRRLHHRSRRDSPRRPTCAACPGWRCRRRSSARSTRRSAARPLSTCPEARTSSARSTGPPGS